MSAGRLWSTEGSLCVPAPLPAQPGSQGRMERRSCQPSAGGDTVLQDEALSNEGEGINTGRVYLQKELKGFSLISLFQSLP